MSYFDKFLDVKTLIGKTLVSIEGAEKGSEDIYFLCDDGKKYHMYHEQDGCENVFVEDIIGDISCLIGTPIVMVEETSNSSSDDVHDPATEEYEESWTWTFYKFATVNGYVTIRWYGESNGYYSEGVSFVEVME